MLLEVWSELKLELAMCFELSKNYAEQSRNLVRNAWMPPAPFPFLVLMALELSDLCPVAVGLRHSVTSVDVSVDGNVHSMLASGEASGNANWTEAGIGVLFNRVASAFVMDYGALG